MTGNDLIQLARLFLVAPLAWIVPARLWPNLAKRLAALDMSLRKREMARQAVEKSRILGARRRQPPEQIVRETIAANYEEHLQVLRDYRPDRWQPETRLVNGDRIEAALADGKGVVLWVSHFVFSGLMTKLALARAGYAVTHLSRPTHGYSNSAFGAHVLNPIQTRIEDRYIRERIRIGKAGPFGPLRILRSRLHDNGVVTITVGDQAQRLVHVPFLAGHLRLPTGPAELARMTGAALLPVFTVREDYWRYAVRIGQPLSAPHLKGPDYPEDIGRQYAEQLAPIVAQHPAHWRSWSLAEMT